MIIITPVSQDNKGRFNRRNITLTGKVLGYDNEVFEGMTDTGKKVFIKVFAKDPFHRQESLTIAVRYTKEDEKTGYEYCSSLGWSNQYQITESELKSIIDEN